MHLFIKKLQMKQANISRESFFTAFSFFARNPFNSSFIHAFTLTDFSLKDQKIQEFHAHSIQL